MSGRVISRSVERVLQPEIATKALGAGALALSDRSGWLNEKGRDGRRGLDGHAGEGDQRRLLAERRAISPFETSPAETRAEMQPLERR